MRMMTNEDRMQHKLVTALTKLVRESYVWQAILEFGREERIRGYEHGWRCGMEHQRERCKELRRKRVKAKK